MSVPSYPFHSLLLKLSNKGMEEYSKMILFIPFYSIQFPPPKRSLSNAPRPILDDYTLQDGYLFKANKLCIPRSSVKDFLVWETHARGLAGHFGQDKTIEEVERQFY